MQLEVGEIYEGKVTGITKFGAFVDLGDGKTGMVHISEVASTFVKEIKDFVTDGQEVKVKVLAIAPDGKISLSMKKAEPEYKPAEKPAHPPRTNFRPRQPRPPVQSQNRPGDYEWQSKPTGGASFEDMMSKFKATSDEKISDLKRSTETKRGGFPSRRDNSK